MTPPIESSPTQSLPAQSPQPLRELTAKSRLRDPRAFMRDAWRDLRAGRATAKRFLAQSIAQRYRYSSLGLLWAVGPSAIAAAALTISPRVRLGAISETGVSPAFYGVFGVILAQIFLEAFNAQRTLFSTHSHLLARQNVPVEGLVLAVLAEAGFSALLKFLVLGCAFAICAVRPVATLPIALAGLIGVLLTGTSLGLLTAPLNSLKRDFDHAMQLLPWALFALTPIFTAPREGGLTQQIYAWNPLSWLFNSIRAASYGAPGSTLPALLALPLSCALLLFSWLLCRLWRPYVVERFLV